MRKIEEPTVEQSDSAHVDTITRHPAYAQISASRVSGGAYLYGSDFQHQNYIRLRISPSEMRRNLSNDHPHAPLKTYVEVDLSEAQWATFVSSVSVGLGVPCTLRCLKGEEISGLPEPTQDRRAQFAAEAQQRAERALSQMDDLSEEIDVLKVSEKQRAALKARLSNARQQLVSNIPFVLEQFGEHMEKTVEKAKVEVNAYMLTTLQRVGLNALKGKPLIALEGKDED